MYNGVGVGLDDECEGILKRYKGQRFSRVPLRDKVAFMAGEVPVYSVLNTALIIYRKRSNMRRAFVIFLAICLIAFSLDSSFVYSPAAWDPGGGELAHVPEQRLLIELMCTRIDLQCFYDEILDHDCFYQILHILC